MKTYRIATIPGDGIGTEVLPEGQRVLEAAGRKFGIGFCDGPPRLYGTRMQFFEVFGGRCEIIVVDDIKTDNNFARKVHEWAGAHGRMVKIEGRAALITKG